MQAPNPLRQDLAFLASKVSRHKRQPPVPGKELLGTRTRCAYPSAAPQSPSCQLVLFYPQVSKHLMHLNTQSLARQQKFLLCH